MKYNVTLLFSYSLFTRNMTNLMVMPFIYEELIVHTWLINQKLFDSLDNILTLIFHRINK